jgi:hypothetical protein
MLHPPIDHVHVDSQSHRLLVLSQAMNRIGLRPGAKTPARSPLDAAPAVDPAQVVEAKFRPVPPSPAPDRKP